MKQVRQRYLNLIQYQIKLPVNGYDGRAIPFTIATNIKYLGISLTINIQNYVRKILYTPKRHKSRF